MPPDETVMTRRVWFAGSEAAWSSARTWCDDVHLRGDLETIGGVAQIVRERARLWMNTSSRGTDRRTRSARFRTSSRTARSATVVVTLESGATAAISSWGYFDALRVVADDPEVGIALRERRRRGKAKTAGRAK